MKTQRPIALYLLAFLVAFQAISGLFGGFSLLLDPTGASLQMPAEEYLAGTPFTDYRLPGLILGILLGLFPVLVFIGLLWKPSWKWAEALNLYGGRHWAWAFSIYLGIMLASWINIQIFLIGGGHFLQFTYGMLGVLLLAVALLPALMRYFESVAD